jgi:putative DNA primase/helicase
MARGGKNNTVVTAGKAAFAAGVERLAQAGEAFAVTHEVWDGDAWLLGTPDGVIDLRTGKTREARPEDYITRLTAVAPASGEDCPLWLKFLEEATGNDQGMIGFLQRWFGYCLTGITREHALVFIHGDGGNGKGVVMNTIFGILGDHAVNAAMETFTVTRGDKHSTDLAMLDGARMVMASEVEEGQTWAEARIKAVTGGDPITARFMRQDNFTFVPRFKLTISGNHKPALRGVDNSTRRRFNIVPFTRRPAVPDPELPEKLKAEWAGILRWMVNGCLEWQRSGLGAPASVAAATDDYFESQDFFGRWIEDRCNLGWGLKSTPAALLRSFEDWCRENREEMTDSRRLRGALEKVKGVYYVKTDGNRIVCGIELKGTTAVKDDAATDKAPGDF